MRIAFSLILTTIAFACIAQDIKIQYAAKNVRNGKSEAGYTYDFVHNLIATRDSVFVFSDNLEFGFAHGATPNQVMYYHLAYSDDLTSRQWKKSVIQPQVPTLTKTGKTKELLGITCDEYECKAGDFKMSLLVTKQLKFKTLAYYPLYFGLSQDQQKQLNFLIGNIDGAVLDMRMGKGDLNYILMQAITLDSVDASKELSWFEKSFKKDKLLKSYTKPFSSINNKPLREGDLAPAFTLPLVDGKLYNPDEWNDYVKVYDFWGIWCSGCVAEIPALNIIREEFKNDNVKFIGFTNDHTAVSANYKVKKPFDFEIAPNADWIMRRFGVGILPTTFIVSKDNVILYRMDDLLIEKSLGKEKYDQAMADFISRVRKALGVQ